MVVATQQVTLDTSTLTIAPAALDDDSALASILVEVDARIGSPTAALNVDPQKAADTVIAVITAFRKDRGLYQRFKVLAAVGEVKFELLARLNRYAPALWHAAHNHKIERGDSDRAVPEEILSLGQEIRKELHRVLDYHFHDDPELGPRLARIRNTNDRLVLANDLRFLATVALDHGDVLVGDRRYKPKRVKQALGVSTDIRSALGADEVAPVRWLDRCAVLWTLVLRDYDELKQVGRFLLRAQPDEAKRKFPSLVKSQGGRRKKTAPTEGEPAAPAEPPKP
jgi:hypothetical protein